MISHHDKFELTYDTMQFVGDVTTANTYFRVYNEVFQPVLTSEIWTISGTVGYGVWEIGVAERKEYKR